MIPLCIYCALRPADSKEHHLPAGFGEFEGYDFLLEKVCQKCNNETLSAFEGAFLRRGPEAVFRLVLGIAGRKHHKKRSAFHGKDFGAPPIRMIAPLPETGQNVYWEFNPGPATPPTLRELRQIILKDEKGEFVPVPIEEGIETPEDLEEVLKGMGLGKVTLDRLIGTPEEQPLLEAITVKIRAAQGAAAPVWTKPADGVVSKGVAMEAHLGEWYWRSVAKIVFHFALTYFPEFDGREPGFAGIRDFIFKGGDHKPFVQYRPYLQILPDVQKGLVPARWMHLLAADKSGGRLVGRAQFFLGPDHVPATCEVFLGTHDHTILHENRRGRNFAYYSDGPRNGKVGEVDRLITL